MWCHDIGREKAANLPLLETIFQAMMRLFGHKKQTLVFVIRDKTKTPFELLEHSLRQVIQKVWEKIIKPQQYKDTALDEFFYVKVIALPSYELAEEDFKNEVAKLRQRFSRSTSSEGLAGGDRTDVLPASTFPSWAQKIWEKIKENKDLHISSLSILAAKERCEEIANEKLNLLATDEEWLHLKEAVKTSVVEGFGETLSSLLNKYLSEYTGDTEYFKESVSNEEGKKLQSKALLLVQPAYINMMELLYKNIILSYRTRLNESLMTRGNEFAVVATECHRDSMFKFDQGCSDASVEQATDWDDTEIRNKLELDIEAHVSSVRESKLTEIKHEHKIQLLSRLLEPLGTCFNEVKAATWASIRDLIHDSSNLIASTLRSTVAGFELDEETITEMVRALEETAKDTAQDRARKEAGDHENVLERMMERFDTVFYFDKDSDLRGWTEENIEAITKEARFESMKVLSILAASRLDDGFDNIQMLMLSTLMGDTSIASTSQNGSTRTPFDLSRWEHVAPEQTLITPVQCKELWLKFVEDSDVAVAKATSKQEEYVQARRTRNIKIAVNTVLSFALACIPVVGVEVAQVVWMMRAATLARMAAGVAGSAMGGATALVGVAGLPPLPRKKVKRHTSKKH